MGGSGMGGNLAVNCMSWCIVTWSFVSAKPGGVGGVGALVADAIMVGQVGEG